MKKILVIFFCFLLFIPITVVAEEANYVLQESEQFIYPGYYFVGTDIQPGIFEIRLLQTSNYGIDIFIFDSNEQYREFYEAKNKIVPKANLFITENSFNLPYHFSLDDDDILLIRDPGIYAIKRVTTTY